MKTIHAAIVCATILVDGCMIRPQAPATSTGVTGGGTPVIQQPSAADIEQQRLAAVEKQKAQMRSAMESVLAKDKALGDRMEAQIPAKAKPAAAATVMSNYASALKSLDMSECPVEFREAYLRHAHAWQNLAVQLTKEPQTVVDAVFQGGVNFFFHGEKDGGVRRLQDAREGRLEAVRTIWGEVEAIAVRYGARLSAQ